MESSINAPHDNEQEEGAPPTGGDWFDDADPAAGDAPAVDVEPTFDPVTQTTSGPLATEPEDAPELTDEEAAGYARTRPDPEADITEEEAFARRHGLDEENQAKVDAQPTPPEPDPRPLQAEQEAPLEQAASAQEPPTGAPKTSGTQERPYVVLREYELDKSFLNELLGGLDKGEPALKVLLVYDEMSARNVEHAIRLAWERQQLDTEFEAGIIPVLGALPVRSLKVRPVKPKVVSRTRLQIG